MVRHNAETVATVGARVAAVALGEAGAALDFPLLRVLAYQPRGLDPAVDALERLVRGPVSRAAFGAAGLRAPDGARAYPPPPAPRAAHRPDTCAPPRHRPARWRSRPCGSGAT